MKRYIPIGIFLVAIFGAAILGSLGMPVAEDRIDQLLTMLLGGGIGASLMRPGGGSEA